MSPEILDQVREKVPKVINKIAQGLGDLSIGPDGRNEIDALDQQEAAMTELLSSPETTREDLVEGVRELVSSANSAYDNSLISEKGLEKIGDKTLSGIGNYRDNLDEETKLNTFGIKGFENAIVPLVALFQRTENASPAQDIRRTTRLLQFRGSKRYLVHERFVNKYLDELIDDKSDMPQSSESAGIKTMWNQPEFLNLMAKRFAKSTQICEGLETHWPYSEQDLFVKTFEAFGFDAGETTELVGFWNSFRANNEGDDVAIRKGKLSAMTTSFAVMSNLMTYGPDTVHDIYKTFGIRNFGRYPAAALLRQYRVFRGEEEYPDKPVILSVAGLNDWTGSMRKYHRRVESAEPIYAEARSLTELVRALIRTKKKLGPLNALIVAGHGKKNEICLDGHSKITTEEITESPALAHIKEKGYFTPGADIILLACSVGKKNGFAQTVSKISGMSVIASSKWTHARIKEDERKEGKHKVIMPNLGPTPPHRRLNPTGNYAYRYTAGKKKRTGRVNLLD